MSFKMWEKFKEKYEAEQTMHESTKRELANQIKEVVDLKKQLRGMGLCFDEETKKRVNLELLLKDLQTGLHQRANDLKRLADRMTL